MSIFEDDLHSEEQVIDLRQSPDIRIYNRTQIIEIDPATQSTHVRDAGPVGPASTAPGPKGDKGDKGEQGEQGPSGVGSIWFESPGSVSFWEISHPFDHDPSVEIRDSTDRVCIAPITFIPGFVQVDISPSNIILKAKLTP